ncbi:MAG: DUF3310 domain-containing protein [bacterium]
MKGDAVSHPTHYKSHPSGVEVIQITEHMNFCLGNVVKYILRAEPKGATIQDLEKAQWYLKREIERRKKELQSGGEVTADDFFNPKKPSSDFLECYT